VFTGLIQSTGTLRDCSASALTIAAPTELLARIRAGDSVAVNGVCLTAVRLSDSSFAADLLPATLADTTLGTLPVGSIVNLEPALRAGEPLGGHIVQGHVDGITELTGIDANRYTFVLPVWLADWVVPKGSICIDGVSLTIQALGAQIFTVELIPETLQRTTLGRLQPGQQVNLEADLIVKTISELVKRSRPNSE
jgi:riboflavin synthase